MMATFRSICLSVAGGVVLSACSEGPEQLNKAVVSSYLQTLIVEEDWAQWDRYFGPNASINGSGFALQIMRGTADGLHFSFSDLQVEIAEQLAEGDRVATRFTLRGVHQRPFNSQPATHRPVELDGFVIDQLAGGRVVESRMLLDVWGLSRRTAAAASQN